MEVRYYITKTGKDVVDEWIAGLADDRAEARIFARIENCRAGTSETTNLWVEGCLSCVSTSAQAIESIAR
jgi:putative component of toxin-antitoxin plasmid stabilization module